MSGVECNEVAVARVGSINRFLLDQKQAPGDGVLTLAQFDHEYECVHRAKPLAEVPPLSRQTFVPRGQTAGEAGGGRSFSLARTRTRSSRASGLARPHGARRTRTNPSRRARARSGASVRDARGCRRRRTTRRPRRSARAEDKLRPKQTSSPSRTLKCPRGRPIRVTTQTCSIAPRLLHASVRERADDGSSKITVAPPAILRRKGIIFCRV